jgi:phage minor structural protein
MALVAVLQNAYKIGYEKRFNEIWTAQFSLPADDPKNAECLPFRFVEIYDAGERVDLFRIIPTRSVKNESDFTVTYTCEHVLATLLDDILFQYHQTTGYTPTQNISYILGYQSVARWQVGTVSFTSAYDYKWENENLLSSLFSLPKAYTGEYQWTWDTTTTLWTLNLIVPSATATARIMYRKNLIGITKEEDPSYIVTRVYPLGYGEGVNQLTIKSVNSGIAYLDASTIGTYGVIAATYVDKAEESAATLMAKAAAWLETVKTPRVAYTVDGADIYAITGETLDRFRDPGILVMVQDADIGEFTARIVSVSKGDLWGEPGNISLEISNKTLDIADTTTSLLKRQHVNDVYAQGATNLDSHDFADNCDPDNPAIVKFYVPEETVRVNKLLLSYEASQFRAYSKATLGGGAATLTSGVSAWFSDPGATSGYEVTDTIPSHDHGGSTGTTSGHSHSIGNDGAHTHVIEDVDHNHEVELPDHIHDIDYGIYLGPEPTAVSIKVDGNTVTGQTATSGDDIDIIPFLDKDGDGKITRGWHEIEITPDDLGRLVVSVIVQLFVQSRGGGDY